MKFTAQKLIALALIIFLSETCCALCCGVAGLAVHHCPLEKSAHCDKTRAEENLSPSFGREGLARTNFCPFISKRFEPAQKTVFDAKPAAAKTFVNPALKVLPGGKAHAAPSLYSSVIRNRGSTYLTNCVFRI